MKWGSRSCFEALSFRIDKHGMHNSGSGPAMEYCEHLLFTARADAQFEEGGGERVAGEALLPAPGWALRTQPVARDHRLIVCPPRIRTRGEGQHQTLRQVSLCHRLQQVAREANIGKQLALAALSGRRQKYETRGVEGIVIEDNAAELRAVAVRHLLIEEYRIEGPAHRGCMPHQHERLPR
jgi:hypothetical protein